MLEIRPAKTLTVPSFASRTVNLDVDLGALAIRYVFSTTITDSDPGNGRLRLSATQQDAALTIRADTLDVNGADVSGLLDAFDDSSNATKGYVRIYAVGDPTKWLTFEATAVASPSGYRNITVSNVAASETSPFEDGDTVLLSFQPTGDRGDVGPVGSGRTYDTMALASAAVIDSDIGAVRTAGYAGAGDGGGALYKRAASEPTHDGKFQSFDGAWWELAEGVVTPKMFGAPGDGTADDGPAIQAALNYLKAAGPGELDLTGNFRVVDGIDISFANGISITSSGGRIEYAETSFSYFHLFRINNCSNITVDGLYIFSDPSLERGDTGFSVQISGSFGVRVQNCRFAETANACVWIDNSQDLIVTGNIIDSGKADGIHFSDGCVDFVCSGNTINGVEDDAIAVVRDVGGVIPGTGAITGNIVRQAIRGHGVVLISCNNVTVSGNDLNGFAGAAIGSYTWSGTEDRATNLFITGNKIRNVGTAPEGAEGASAIMLVANNGVVVKGNDIQGPSSVVAGFPNPCVLFVNNSLDINFEGNDVHDSAKYGVLVNPDSVSFVTGLRVFGNNFRNISEAAVMAAPALGVLGAITVHANTFEDVAYGVSPSRVIDIRNAGANRVYVGGNKQLNQAWPSYVDPATCSNVFAEDNTPSLKIIYDPNERAGGGVAFTSSTGTGTYWRSNGMVFVKIVATITTKGAGDGLLVDLPVPSDAGASALQFRETAATGMVGTAEFNSPTSLFLSPADAAQGAPVADGRTIQITGWYTA